MRSACELVVVRAHLHEKRHVCALLVNDEVLSCPRHARSEHIGPVNSGGIEVFQRVWRAECSHSTVGGSEAAASSSQPRKAARHQAATFGALHARQARATRPQQPHVTVRRPQHHFAGQQAGGRVGFSWQHACGRSNGPPEGDLAINKAGYGLLQNRTAGGRGAEILGLLIYTYETIRKVCRMFCDLGSETPLKKMGWRNAASGWARAPAYFDAPPDPVPD